MLEFTVDDATASTIAAEMAATAHGDMRRWMAGDRTPDNCWCAAGVDQTGAAVIPTGSGCAATRPAP
jgi:hypothetical protein